MLFSYANVLVFALVGVGFAFGALLLGAILRPQVPTLEKLSTYECGELPVGSAWMNFNIRYYIVALIFVVFDVEVAFMFPIARVFRALLTADAAAGTNNAIVALLEIFAFLFILVAGFIYVWIKGDLDWVKKIVGEVKAK